MTSDLGILKVPEKREIICHCQYKMSEMIASVVAVQCEHLSSSAVYLFKTQQFLLESPDFTVSPHTVTNTSKKVIFPCVSSGEDSLIDKTTDSSI